MENEPNRTSLDDLNFPEGAPGEPFFYTPAAILAGAGVGTWPGPDTLRIMAAIEQQIADHIFADVQVGMYVPAAADIAQQRARALLEMADEREHQPPPGLG